MKRIKKLAAFMMALVMVFVMAVPVLATETPKGEGSFSIDIKNKAKGHEYSAYQIFKGKLLVDGNETTLADIEWGDHVQKDKAAEIVKKLKETGKFDGLKEDASAADVAKELGDETNGHDTNKAKAFADVIASYITESGAGSATASEETDEDGFYHYKIENLPAGYYFVKDTGDIPDSDAATRYILQVVNDVTPTAKSDTITTEKKILDDVDGDKTDDEVDVNEAAIGDEVKYQIKTTLPNNYADYKAYSLVYEDTFSKGLEFKNNVKITVDGKEILPENYSVVSSGSSETQTVVKIGIEDLKTVAPGATNNSVILVTYSATLTKDAVIAGAGNPNTVVLKYTNDPNAKPDGTWDPENPSPTTPSGKTPEDKVVTFTTEFAILKTDQDGNIKPVEGAEFTLTGEGVTVNLVEKEEFVEAEDGKYYQLTNGSYTLTDPVETGGEDDTTDKYVKGNDGNFKKYTFTRTFATKDEGANTTEVKATLGEDGRITFSGLGKGTYTLKESRVPAGYNKIEDIPFTINFTPDEAKLTGTFDSGDSQIVLGKDNNTFQSDIINQKGSLLPSTGGIGTTIFYVVGAILVIGAGIILVAKKRMAKEV